MTHTRVTSLSALLVGLTLLTAAEAEAEEVVLGGRLWGGPVQVRVALDADGSPRSARVGRLTGAAVRTGSDTWDLHLSIGGSVGVRGRLAGEDATSGTVLRLRRVGDGWSGTWVERGRVLATLTARSGGERRGAYRRLLARLRGKPEREQIEQVNAFFSSGSFTYRSDPEAFGRSDYWATPDEFLELGRGDCEDYAFAKYFALRELGVPADRLRMWLVDSASQGAHMVAAYAPSAGADPLILDSLTPRLRRASDRIDLRPTHSLSDDGRGMWRTQDWRRPEDGIMIPYQKHRDLLRRMGRDLPPAVRVTVGDLLRHGLARRLDSPPPSEVPRSTDRPLGQ
jgi:predicted transglutaminase-like cysteine proteinase